MATLYELSRLAQAVYGDVPDPPGWSRLKTTAGSYGFQAAAFQANGETILAFRGTTGNPGDWAADAMLSTGLNTSHFGQADDFVDNFRGADNLTLCGHSLGGAMAQVAGNRGRIKFATFNAPGVAVFASRNVGELATSAVVGTAKIRAVVSTVGSVLHPIQAMKDVKSTFYVNVGVNICLLADVVSQVGVHYGKVVRIRGTSMNPATEHSIKTVVEVLGKPDCPEGKLTIQSYFT